MKLSEQLKKLRAERPDEWTMDRFISMAEYLENEEAKIKCQAILSAVRETQDKVDNDDIQTIKPSKLEAYARSLLK